MNLKWIKAKKSNVVIYLLPGPASPGMNKIGKIHFRIAQISYYNVTLCPPVDRFYVYKSK